MNHPLFTCVFGALLFETASTLAQVDTAQVVAPGGYFHEGDSRRGHRNNGWIVFDDFARQMEGATEIKCSQFGDNIIAHM